MLPATSTFGLSENIAREAISLPCALLFCAKEKIVPIAKTIGSYMAGANASSVQSGWFQLPSRSHILGGLLFAGAVCWMMRDSEKEEDLEQEEMDQAKEAANKAHWEDWKRRDQALADEGRPKNQFMVDPYEKLNKFLASKPT